MVARSLQRQPHGVRLAAIALTLIAATLVLSLVAPPAGAIIVTLRGRGYGVTPIRGVDPASIPGSYRAPGLSASPGTKPFDEPPQGGGPLLNHGGPVMHSVTTHVIYWDPNTEFTTTTKALVNKFFTDVAHDKELPTNVFSIAGQYEDGTGHAAYLSTYAGEKADANAYPVSGCSVPVEEFADPGPPYTRCITDTQLKEELSAFITAESLPTGSAQQYFVLLPHKVVTCLEAGVCSNNFYCAYHSYVNPGTVNEVIYSDIPFSLLDTEFVKGCQDDGNEGLLQHPNGDIAGTNASTRFGDVALKYTSHEYIEASTDPLVNNSTAWADAHGNEIGDKCNGVHGPASGIGHDAHSFVPTLGGEATSENLFNQAINAGDYYLQSEWDNAAKACTMRPVPIASTGFRFSASPKVGVAVSFEGAATDIYGALKLTWKFGDLTAEGAGAAPGHVYGAPGTYEATMIATDELTGAKGEPVTHNVVVNDAPSAAFSISPNPVHEGTAVGFDGSASSDADGSVVEYAWDFGDGSPAGSGSSPSHAYAGPGTYAVTLKILDTGGQTASVSRQITVDGPPVVSTASASSLTQTSAALSGTVNPAGTTVAECRFEYGPTTAYGASVPCTPAPGSGNGMVAVSAVVTSLSPGAAYHFRLVATNVFGARNSSDATFATTSVPVVSLEGAGPPPESLLAVIASSAFTAREARINPATGAITLAESVAQPGSFSWLLTFQNGKFGAFASGNTKCKAGFARLGGKCRPAKIVFAKGTKTVTAAGTVIFTLKPSASALRALKNALKQRKGLPVTATLRFQSSVGGSPVSHTQSLMVKLKKK